MSQNRDVNFDDAPNRSMSRILAGMDPEPLRIERDELFFQAGLAACCAHSLSSGERAGVRGLNSLRLWQATAAALLVACAGLSATTFRQGMISTTDSSTESLRCHCWLVQQVDPLVAPISKIAS